MFLQRFVLRRKVRSLSLQEKINQNQLLSQLKVVINNYNQAAFTLTLTLDFISKMNIGANFMQMFLVSPCNMFFSLTTNNQYDYRWPRIDAISIQPYNTTFFHEYDFVSHGYVFIPRGKQLFTSFVSSVSSNEFKWVQENEKLPNINRNHSE